MADMMNAAVKVRGEPGAIEYKQVPRPEPGQGEVLIKIKATSICGTDLHIYDWDEWSEGRIETPRIQGHEWTGHVEALGPGVDKAMVKIGDFVSGENHLVCNRCIYCRTGRAHLCANTVIVGIDQDGSFAEYMTFPAGNIWVNSPSLKPEWASLQDPLGNAVQVAFSAKPSGKSVAVLGMGPIGLMTVGVCRQLGAEQIIATDVDEGRLALAKEMGATHVVNARDDVAGLVRSLTEDGVEEVMEMSGAAPALTTGLEIVQKGGGVHILGIYKEPVAVDITNHIVVRGVRVVGIFGRLMYDTWYQMKGLLDAGGLDLDPVITHRMSLEKAAEAFEVQRAPGTGKVIMYPFGE